MYNDMTPENMDKRCPAKIICQAFESREIIGNFKPLFYTYLAVFLTKNMFLGGSQSYLSLFYQFINSMKFVSNMEIDDNYLTVGLFKFAEKMFKTDLNIRRRPRVASLDTQSAPSRSWLHLKLPLKSEKMQN